jgi:prepilin-type N-terminal cleavage/methylation domain-containing protein
MSKMKVLENTNNYMHRVRRTGGKAGFTLVETIVAMAIIAIVSVMLISGMTAAMTMWNHDTDSRNQSAQTEVDIAENTEPTDTKFAEIHMGTYTLPTDIDTYAAGRESHTVLGEAYIIPDGMELDGTPEAGFGGATGEYRVVQDGRYKLEVWGAAGGGTNGGVGGYSVGTVTLKKGDKLYLYAGGKGFVNTRTSAGFNGGGWLSTNSYISPNQGRGTGGGASDIRINTDSLYARVIVAGGGSGCTYDSASTAANPGGAGGGTNGAGTSYATQVRSGSSAGTLDQGAKLGGFGFGAIVNSGGGGGGGWYGGGNRGGGSGWIFTESTISYWKTNAVANVANLNEDGSPVNTSNWLLDSEYYLSNAQTFLGTSSIPDPRHNDIPMTDKLVHGFVRISWVGL